jgi:hypothetical protein
MAIVARFSVKSLKSSNGEDVLDMSWLNPIGNCKRYSAHASHIGSGFASALAA